MKLVAPSKQIITAQAMTGNITSSTIDVTEHDVCGIQLNYTGSPVGSISVLGTIDGTNFATLTFNVSGSSTSSLAIPSSTSPIILDLTTGSLIGLQVVYTFTSGTGTLNGFATKKRLGD